MNRLYLRCSTVVSVVMMCMSGVSCSGGSGSSDGSDSSMDVGTIEADFLAVCSAPSVASDLNSNDSPINHYTFEGDTYLSGFNIESGFVFSKLDIETGTATAVEENIPLSYFREFGHAERIGQQYLFKGYTDPEEDLSGLFVYNAETGIRIDVSNPTNFQINAFGDSEIVGERMYVGAERELWRYELESNLLELVEIEPDASEFRSEPDNLMTIDNFLIFRANPDNTSDDLFVLNTETGVVNRIANQATDPVFLFDPIVANGKLYFIAYRDSQLNRIDLYEYSPGTQLITNLTEDFNQGSVNPIGGFTGFRSDGQYLYWIREIDIGSRVYQFHLTERRFATYDIFAEKIGAVVEFSIVDNILIALLEATSFVDLDVGLAEEFPDIAVLDLNASTFQLIDLVADKDSQVKGLKIYDGISYFTAGTPFTDELGFTDLRFDLWRMNLDCL